MSNRNKESKRSAEKTHRIELYKVELSREDEIKYFPGLTTPLFPYEICTLEMDGYITCYLCFEDVGTVALGVHIYMIPECRTHTVLKAMKYQFNRVISKYMKSRNKSSLTTFAKEEEAGVYKLMVILGFKIETYFTGTINY